MLFKKKSGKIVTLPQHKPPKLHPHTILSSMENCRAIHRTYKEVIGLNGVTHFSINIIGPDDDMMVLSMNPSIIQNICHDGSYLYNGSISSTYYEKMDIYTWDECYDTRYRDYMIKNMERRHGIQKGVVLVRNLGHFKALYSFATSSKKIGVDFKSVVNEARHKYYAMGDHCYDMVKDIYSIYSQELVAPLSKKIPIVGKPFLQLVK